ncbi:MAG: sigma-70 family RNA polymerase sigma factor [Pirellulaceae bacterium]
MSNMHDTQLGFCDLMKRVEAGDAQAEQALIEQYGSHILKAIRRRLHPKMRIQYDSQDFCQAVWASFFAHRSEMGRFKSDRELLAFLGRMGRNKVVDEVRRRLMGQKSNINQTRSIHESELNFGHNLAGNSPTPSELAVAREQIERLTNGQPVKYRRILEMRASGATYKDIAERVGMNERNVRRVIERMERQIDN